MALFVAPRALSVLFCSNLSSLRLTRNAGRYSALEDVLPAFLLENRHITAALERSVIILT